MSILPSPLGVVTSPPATPTVPAAAAVPAPTQVPLWPRSAQVAAVALTVIATGLLGWNVYGSHRRATRPVDLDPGSLAFRIDLNHADHAQLLQLPGVGEALARHIEDYRAENYGFRSVEELKQVHGIGPATLERLRHLVYVDAPAGDGEWEAPPAHRAKSQWTSRKQQPGGARTFVSKKEEAITAPIDVNRASAEELQRLPGIGPGLAGRIVEARKSKSFKSVDDLRHVSGIGPKTLEKVKPFVSVGQASKDAAKE